LTASWRLAQPTDDESLVDMCFRLNEEDPGHLPVPAENMRRTLAELRRNPRLGRAVVLEIQREVSGYALLIAFWSNEFGGNVCEVDELFVMPEHRRQGHGTSLFVAIAQSDLWPDPLAAIALGVTTDNARARRLYERLGFATFAVSSLSEVIKAAIHSPG